MVRVRADWVRREANKELDSYLRQRAWHWAVRRNYALAADYVIRLLNRRPKDPLALLLGEVAAAQTHQEVFAEKCREAQRRLCFTKGVGEVTELLMEGPSPSAAGQQQQPQRTLLPFLPSREEVRALMDDARAESAAATGPREERIVVGESAAFLDVQAMVRRHSLQASPQAPLCEVLEPTGTVYGRGLYATQRIPPRTPILMDKAFVVQRTDENRCAHCLKPLHGDGGSASLSRGDGAVGCPHCSEEVYCSSLCQEAAWRQYHGCCCRSVNPGFADWSAAMMETLYAESGETTEADATSQARAALSCLGVAKLFAMATMQQLHPLKLDGVSALRGVADYEPATALSEVGALAVTLAAMLQQSLLCMEEVLSLLALWQTNEFLLPGGTALYSVLSLINHSCDPNCAAVKVATAPEETARVLIALREIRDGEQLFMDYNTHLTSKLDYEQRKALCAQRHFTCFCVKCVRRL